jgi:hypothetical protein
MSTKTELTARYSEIRATGHLTGTLRECVAKRLAREANTVTVPVAGKWAVRAAINRIRRAKPVIVPLGDAGRDVLERYQRSYPRLREWSLVAAATASETRVREKGSNSDWNKRSTFQRGVLVHSTATCTPQVATLNLDGEITTVRATRGYRWDIDDNGLCLRGSVGEYHPTASELQEAAQDRCAALVAALKGAAATRRKLAREARAAARKTREQQEQERRILRTAEREGLTVCLADSLRAGNCRAGTLNWATAHGFQAGKHPPGSG